MSRGSCAYRVRPASVLCPRCGGPTEPAALTDTGARRYCPACLQTHDTPDRAAARVA